MSFPKFIPKRHESAVVELLRCYLQIKNAPKPVARLHPRDRGRLLRAEVAAGLEWRSVLHWYPSREFWAQKQIWLSGKK
jgi:hypothetical protein